MDYEEEEKLKFRSIERFARGEARLLDKDLNDSSPNLYYYLLEGKGYNGAVNRDFQTDEYFTGANFSIFSKKLVKLKTPIPIPKEVKELPKEEREGRTIDSYFVGDQSFDSFLDVNPEDVGKNPLKNLTGIAAKILPFAIRSNQLQGEANAIPPDWTAYGVPSTPALAPELQPPEVLPAEGQGQNVLQEIQVLRFQIDNLINRCVNNYARTRNDVFRQYAANLDDFLRELPLHPPDRQLEDCLQIIPMATTAIEELEREPVRQPPPARQPPARITGQEPRPVPPPARQPPGQEPRPVPPPKSQTAVVRKKRDEGSSSLNVPPELRPLPDPSVFIRPAPPPKSQTALVRKKKDEGSSSSNVPPEPRQPPPPKNPFEDVGPAATEPVPQQERGPLTDTQRKRGNKERHAMYVEKAKQLYPPGNNFGWKRDRYGEISMLLNDGDFTQKEIRKFVEFTYISDTRANENVARRRLENLDCAEMVFSHNRINPPHKAVHLLLGKIANISPSFITKWLDLPDAKSVQTAMRMCNWVMTRKGGYKKM